MSVLSHSGGVWEMGRWEAFSRTMVASLGITWHSVLMLLSYHGSALPRYPATSQSSSWLAAVWSCR